MSEARIRASQAGRLFPPGRHGLPRKAATVARYIRDGVRGVRLEGGRDTSGSWWTTAEAVSRFLAELTGLPPVPTTADRRAGIAAARQRLAEMRGR